MSNDQPYRVGDHITFIVAPDGATQQTGTIIATAPQVVLDGSQTAYTVELDGDTAGGTTLIGIAHTDVVSVDVAPEPETAPTPEATVETSASESDAAGGDEE
jgi:hypothetical protein